MLRSHFCIPFLYTFCMTVLHTSHLSVFHFIRAFLSALHTSLHIAFCMCFSIVFPSLSCNPFTHIFLFCLLCAPFLLFFLRFFFIPCFHLFCFVLLFFISLCIRNFVLVHIWCLIRWLYAIFFFLNLFILYLQVYLVLYFTQVPFFVCSTLACIRYFYYAFPSICYVLAQTRMLPFYRISPRVNLNEIAIIVRTWDPYIRVLTKAITDAGFRVAPRVMLEGSFPVESFIKVLRPRERSGVAATNEDEKGTEEQHLKEIATELRRAQRRCGVKVTPPSKIKEAILTARKNFSSKNKSMFPEVVVHAAEGTGYLSVLGRCYANPRKKLVRTFAEFGDIDEMDLITQPESSQSKKGGAQPVRGINILTAHSAKGREFDAVIILGIGVSFPYYRALPKEEERLLYVAMTRARRHLALSFPQLPLNSKYEFRQVHSYGSNFFDGIVSTRALSFPGHAALVRKTVDEEESETWD
eukprot:Rmarinus@m.28736